MHQMCVGLFSYCLPDFMYPSICIFIWLFEDIQMAICVLIPTYCRAADKREEKKILREVGEIQMLQRERGRGRSAKMGICQIKGNWGCWHSHWSAELSYLIQSPFILPLVSAHHRLSVFSPHGKLFCICRTDNCDNTSWCSTTLPNLMWLVHLQAPPNINYFKTHCEIYVYGGRDGDGEDEEKELLLLREKTFWLRCLLS